MPESHMDAFALEVSKLALKASQLGQTWRKIDCLMRLNGQLRFTNIDLFCKEDA